MWKLRRGRQLAELRGKGESLEQARALLDRALHFGISDFDTANTYGGGRSEEILGEWMRDLPVSIRREIRVSTKVGNPNGCAFGEKPLSKSQIEFHLDKSLRRLRVEQIHVYYLHEMDLETPLSETLEALQGAVKSGKIASFGLSNVNQETIEKYIATAGAFAEKLTHVQNEYHFLKQVDRENLIPFLAEKNIRYVAFSPLAGGILTGKYLTRRTAPTGSRLALRPEPYRLFMTRESRRTVAQFIQKSKS